MTKDDYIGLNSSFRNRAVFRLGYDAGFFSEYNNMILAAVYCATKRIQFQINSSFANFRLKKGWEDFFLPFFPEDSRSVHRDYNYRPYLKASTWRINLLKKYYGIDFLTQDLWNHFRDPEFLNGKIQIPKLGFEGTLLEICNFFVHATWQLQPKIKNAVGVFKNELNLPEDYIGMHLRRGDKSNETNIIHTVPDYLRLVKRKTACKNLFVASDDVSVISQICQTGDWNVYHRISPHAVGYNQAEFDKKTSESKFIEIVDLFCNVEVLCNANVFVGTADSNIAMFVGMARKDSNCFYLDADSWSPR